MGAWRAMFAKAGLDVLATGPMFDMMTPIAYYVLHQHHPHRKCRDAKCSVDTQNPMLALSGQVFGDPVLNGIEAARAG